MKVQITMDDGFKFTDKVICNNLLELSEKLFNGNITRCILDRHTVRVKEIKRIKVIGK